MIPGRTELSAPTRHQEPAAPLAAPPLRTSCSPSVGADAYIGPTGFFPHPRQGTRALPYKVLCYRAQAGRVVRPYAPSRTRRAPCNPSVGADAYIGPIGFFPHPRQGTRALPYKVLCYRAQADRVVRPYTPSRTRRAPCSPSVGADAYIGPTVFFPHPRQDTRALPYKVLCYRARADRVVRPYAPP